jgi:hypothetical protein
LIVRIGGWVGLILTVFLTAGGEPLIHDIGFVSRGRFFAGLSFAYAMPWVIVLGAETVRSASRRFVLRIAFLPLFALGAWLVGGLVAAILLPAASVAIGGFAEFLRLRPQLRRSDVLVLVSLVALSVMAVYADLQLDAPFVTMTALFAAFFVFLRSSKFPNRAPEGAST